MSKNLYRINKKSDLDEVIKNNFYKPTYIIFVSKSLDKKLYNEIAETLKSLSKVLTYGMILIIDFDDFIDNVNFFAGIKETIPYMISYFKAKQIATCHEKENFIAVMVNTMTQIHDSYLNKLTNVFNQTNNSGEPEQTKKSDEVKVKDDPVKKTTSVSKSKNKEKSKKEVEGVEGVEGVEDAEDTEEEVEEEVEEVEEEEEVEDLEDLEEDKTKSVVNKKSSNTKENNVEIDNSSEEIHRKKEKLREIRRLKELLSK
jgi:hypothetical protein